MMEYLSDVFLYLLCCNVSQAYMHSDTGMHMFLFISYILISFSRMKYVLCSRDNVFFFGLFLT